MEYYLAIKRKASESVLMRWMNLEPEVSQKEKDKCYILMLIKESRKMVLKNLFAGQQWKNTHGEQTHEHVERGGEGKMRGESNMVTYITMCRIESLWEFAVYLRKLKEGLCINLEWWDGGGRWEGGPKGTGYMYTYG